MEKELLKLNALLSKNREEFYGELNAPLKASAIKALEEEYNIILPDDLKKLYLWKNGQSEESYDALANNQSLLSLESVFETHRILSEQKDDDFKIKNWWNKAWIPFLHDGGGNYLCYDTEGSFTDNKGQLLTFWHDENDRNVEFPNLLSYIEAMIALHEDEDFDEDDDELETENPKGFPLKFKVS